MQNNVRTKLISNWERNSLSEAVNEVAENCEITLEGKLVSKKCR